jgi:hypothetical protein
MFDPLGCMPGGPVPAKEDDPAHHVPRLLDGVRMVTKEDVYVVRGLVNGHDCRHFDDLGGDSKSLDELECDRGIETSI